MKAGASADDDNGTAAGGIAAAADGLGIADDDDAVEGGGGGGAVALQLKRPVLAYQNSRMAVNANRGPFAEQRREHLRWRAEDAGVEMLK